MRGVRVWFAHPARDDFKRRAILVLSFVAAPILDEAVALAELLRAAGRGIGRAAREVKSTWPGTKRR